MKRLISVRRYFRYSDKGFSLVEMVIVLSLIGILLAIATPAFVTWRGRLNYRQASINFISVLRQAKSLAMSANRQYYVVFKPYSSGNTGIYAYRLIKRSVDPTNTTFANYSCVQKSGTNALVAIRGTTSAPMANIGFTFNSNGTALLTYPGGITNDGNIGIYNGTAQKYLVTVSKTGRINSTNTSN